ncbi:hypothetical protein DRO69_02855 [Candidatus Bathyarchaeota archaeon]|nr:hypothetical protein [Candidatus Culexmicrobium cathedralense]RLI46541.1 MAG: hypothetical protein DRO69_02855 [Candidatus Bathyarchaeota archaeon]
MKISEKKQKTEKALLIRCDRETYIRFVMYAKVNDLTYGEALKKLLDCAGVGYPSIVEAI